MISANPELCALTVPVTFPSGRAKGKARSRLIEQSFSSASPSCITFWGLQNQIAFPESEISSSQGVAVGCRDGSVFVLRAIGRPGTFSPVPPSFVPPDSTSIRRFPGLGNPSSRPASPSSTKSSLSPFHVTRSRIVSGVSNEQVEAPKNYVDFDDEQAKLKGMLKGKGHNRHSSTSRTRSDKDSFTETPSIPAVLTTGSSLRREDTRSYLSAALSPTSSTLSLPLSSPPSPTLAPAVSPESGAPLSLSLGCHIFPPRTGPRHPVSSLKLHEGGRYMTCLQNTGGLSVHSTLDGTCFASVVCPTPELPALGAKARSASHVLWVWKTLLVAASEESIILFACASPDDFYPAGQYVDSNSGDSENHSFIAAYELCLATETQGGEVKLEYLSQLSVGGSVGSIGLLAEPDHSLTLFYTNSSGHLISRNFRVNDAPPFPPPDLPESHSATHLPLPNPFKVLKSLSTDHIPDTARETATERIKFADEIDNGVVGLKRRLLGLRAHDEGATVRLCAWSAEELLVLQWSDERLEPLPAIAKSGIHDVNWIDHDSFSALSSKGAEVYRIVLASKGEDANQLHTELVRCVPLTPNDAAALISGGHLISTYVKNGFRRVRYTACDALSESTNVKTRLLWQARLDASTAPCERRVTSMLPLEPEVIILGYSDGRLGRSSLLDLTRSAGDSRASDIPLSGSIVISHPVTDHRTGERLLVGGADDGSIGIWSLETLKLTARWTVFATPLVRVIPLHDEKVGRLQGCVLCISQDGTIAVVALDGLQFVYLIPASAAPLRRLCLGEDNVLLIYGDGRARLWDTRTGEFWRSMNVEKGEELMQEGGWLQRNMDIVPGGGSVLATLSPHVSLDAASTLLVDISTLLRQFSTSAASTGPNGPISVKARLEHARALLSILLTFGISEGIDSICSEALFIMPCAATIGLMNSSAVSLIPQPLPSIVWSLSPEVSADRALAIISLLQYLTQFEDLAQDATTVMTFYAASMGQLVGDLYQPPSLPRLGHHLLHSLSTEVRQAARLLFDAGVARLSDQEATTAVETWQQHLPSLRTEGDRDSTQSALALCICGFIAVDKYSLLPTSVLTDIAKSIAAYLHDETSPHRSLAIDLCSRGFQVWQQYVDAVEMLRALFTLATTTKKEAISVTNTGAQARLAILQIAASNTPLFMTTLAIDILHPRSVQHRKSVLQLVIFLIRKKPLVLYSNLPRLVEAIVKSLDPNSSATREAVLDSATEILGHIVQTFPTVDFHMASQRLAVGTIEGAVVMYDLKTATRLYVLEGHKKRTTACSFSPDGRRLVTVSLEESDVLVWKVGSSFTSFFMPGVPPRQGHSGSEPFKTLSFNVGDAANMSVEGSFVDVQFEWTAERSVKLKIKDSTLTFST